MHRLVAAKSTENLRSPLYLRTAVTLARAGVPAKERAWWLMEHPAVAELDLPCDVGGTAEELLGNLRPWVQWIRGRDVRLIRARIEHLGNNVTFDQWRRPSSLYEFASVSTRTATSMRIKVAYMPTLVN
ncbi:hypothetical protein JB92DRAFT_3094456 [Gautieria morchelliformis]|nr:hypothetical protein JB92DRAFT_3094456 [Gautieria morchelliformis]